MKRAKSRATRAEDHVKSGKGKYAFWLYVTGLTPSSVRAIANAKAICEQHLQGRYNLHIIDLYQQPKLAKAEQIIAAPTLIKKLPQPIRRLVGDLSKRDVVIQKLELRSMS